MKTAVFASLLMLVLPVPRATADDLFYADGKANVVRTLTWQKKILSNVQLGEWRPDGVEIFHSEGRTVVSVTAMPGLWQKALWTRMAGRLAPPGAGAAVIPQIASGLATAKEIATRMVPVSGKKADGSAFSGYVIAGKDGALLMATATGAAWMPETGLMDAKKIRTELECSISRRAWAVARVQAETEARDRGKEANLQNGKLADAVKKAVTEWEAAHPKPSAQPPTAQKKVDPLKPALQ